MFDKSKAAHNFIHKALRMCLPARIASIAVTTSFLASTLLLLSDSLFSLDCPAEWGQGTFYM